MHKHGLLTTSIRWITLLAWVVSAQTAHGQEGTPEIRSVVQQVLSQQDWTNAAKACPVEVMGDKPSTVTMLRSACRSPQMPTCLKSCEAGHGESCYWLGQALEETKSTPKAVQVLYHRSCQLGIVSGCTNRAAQMLDDVQQQPEISECSVKTFAKGCTLEDPWACTMYGLQLTQGMGVVKNNALALQALKKSCKLGTADPACQYGMALKKRIEDSEKGPTQKP